MSTEMRVEVQASDSMTHYSKYLENLRPGGTYSIKVITKSGEATSEAATTRATTGSHLSEFTKVFSLSPDIRSGKHSEFTRPNIASPDQI